MDFEVDGRMPVRVQLPESPEALCDLVREARTEGRGLVAWGRGLDVGVGNEPARYDAAVLTAGLAGIAGDYSPADLVVTAGAGTTVGDLQAFLAVHGQRLPLDAPPEATLGGVVGANRAGPLRLSQGTVRDWLVGLQAVTGEGRLVRSGGRVVKNVSGYDLGKLFCGSRGTLGILTELSFKVAPLPETTEVHSVVCPDLGAAREIRRTALAARVAWLELFAAGEIRVEIGFEGHAEDVADQVGRLADGLRPDGLELLPERGYPRPPGQHEPPHDAGAIRIGMLPARLIETLAQGPWQALAAHLGNGIARVTLPAGDALAHFATWRRLAARAGGWAILECGPKAGIDVFGESRPGWALGHALKRVFDPDRVMAPGRGPGRV